jgi:hypothetical protein
VNDPAGDVQVELGSSDYLKRYKTYVSHVQEWRQQFQKLESVNLRYDNQVIVNPDMVKPDPKGKPKQFAIAPAAAKAAAASSVKPASLLTRIGPNEKLLPKPAFELSEKKLDPTGAKKTAPKPRLKRTKATKVVAPKKSLAKSVAPNGKTANAKTTAAPHKPAQSTPRVPNSVIRKPSPAIAKRPADDISD